MSETSAAKVKGEQKTVRLQALDRIEKLPSLSNVVGEFLALAKREYFTAKDFEKVISKDQALVARLLKVANSSMYSRRRTVDTIPEAVVLIGLDNMKKIVYAVSSEGLLRQDLKCYRYPDKGFWLHSMAAGMISRALAETSPRCGLKGEEAFVAGLMHDVGKLILDDFLDAEKGIRDVTCEEEVDACGLDHTELAEQIMKRWKIPEPIHTAVRYHHEPAAGEQWRTGATLIHLADAICNHWGIGKQALMDLGEEIPTEQHAEALAAIGLPEGRIPQLLLDIRQKLVSIAGIYDDDE